VKLGVISYGVYVYSWMLLVAIKHSFTGLSEVQAGVLHILVSLPVSAVLFKYYERPITDWGRRAAAQLANESPRGNKNDASDTGRHAYEVEKREQASIVVT
jgi:peptidoglycan/LPS O-acetylase OafA/YrhL